MMSKVPTFLKILVSSLSNRNELNVLTKGPFQSPSQLSKAGWVDYEL